METQVGTTSETKSKTFTYVKYDTESTAQSEACKEQCEKLEAMITDLGPGRYQSSAKTYLEIVFMMIGKAIRDNQMAKGSMTEHVAERTNVN